MDYVLLGTKEVWGQDEPVWLSRPDRRQHLHLIGGTGVGKSTLIRNLIIQDIEAGRGVCLIDLHGDEAERLLDYIPRDRTDDVCYLDLTDPEHHVGFNVLANVPTHRRHLVASGVVGAFKAVYPDFFGPRMEYIFYAAVAALLDCKNVSLLSLQRMLTDERYRIWVVKQVKDPLVRKFWEHEFEMYDKRTKAEMVSPILNKVGPLFMSPQMRNVVGQVWSSIDMREMMDTGKIVIVNLAKGKLGEDKSNLLGAFLVSQFHLAAMSRADIPEHERRDFFLYVDEFQSIVSDSFASILSEARKYRLCLTISHQHLGQLKPSIVNAIMGNVGSFAAFRVGHEDAEALEKAFGRTYPASAFTSLNNGQIYAKLLSRGQSTEPILCRTLPPQGRFRGRRETIVRQSRQRYATTREIVERRINTWVGISNMT